MKAMRSLQGKDLFIYLASDLLLDSLLAAYSNAGMNSEDGNSIYRSRKRPVLVSLLAAYNNAGKNSEDGTSVYRSRKRPATCWRKLFKIENFIYLNVAFISYILTMWD